MVQAIYETERLWLVLSQPSLAVAVTDYFCRNRNFLQPTEATHLDEFFTVAYQEKELQKAEDEAKNLSGLRFWLSKKEANDKIIGMVALNNIIWGSFRSAFFSYRLDEQEQGHGYMTEAAAKLTKIAFGELNLHRLEANIMPRNKPSTRVAEKLGFSHEGLAKRYLHINGVWEDHIHMVKLNE